MHHKSNERCRVSYDECLSNTAIDHIEQHATNCSSRLHQ